LKADVEAILAATSATTADPYPRRIFMVIKQILARCDETQDEGLIFEEERRKACFQASACCRRPKTIERCWAEGYLLTAARCNFVRKYDVDGLITRVYHEIQRSYSVTTSGRKRFGYEAIRRVTYVRKGWCLDRQRHHSPRSATSSSSGRSLDGMWRGHRTTMSNAYYFEYLKKNRSLRHRPPCFDFFFSIDLFT
jgi:hypothetical protein